MTARSGTTTYTYDAVGQLVAENASGITTSLLIDPTGLGNAVGQFAADGTPLDQYAYGLGLVSQVSPNAGTAYYNFYLTGDTTQLTGAGGSVVDSYSYLPFGELLSSSGSVSNSFTYVGKYGVIDTGNGLYDARNRLYAANLGRFTAPDPLGTSGGDLNPYRYADNTPTRSIPWAYGPSAPLSVCRSARLAAKLALLLARAESASFTETPWASVEDLPLSRRPEMSPRGTACRRQGVRALWFDGNNFTPGANQVLSFKPAVAGGNVALGGGPFAGVSTDYTNTIVLWGSNKPPPPPDPQAHQMQQAAATVNNATPTWGDGQSITSAKARARRTPLAKR